MTCPSCKRFELRPWHGCIIILGIEIEAHGMGCELCREMVFDTDEVERQEEEVADALVERGICAGNELALVRKQAGLQAKELAEILDVRPETISRWERGQIPIPPTVAYVVGDLYLHPKATRQRLAALHSRAGR